jgi:hypothetical protein
MSTRESETAHCAAELRARIGALVRDETRGRVGVLMAVGAYCDPASPPSLHQVLPPAGAPLLAYLRPEGGGREWTVPPEAVTVLAPAEALREKLRGANARSSSGGYGRRG